ncbi:hypothetical protein ISF9_062 [Microbacterium phage vB_MoxS-ISF9]|uniref:Uncharacterized protein n=1 Tax=Microbacterium phage vB_MoxS-ISF9 TaxID=1458670 RepID=W8P0A7_9CAUD|nr:hypothetical protein ISF9_062 [Microbacterium phage vB_MoxS-ISF9]AHL18532.1 hypothetical protein ISF9_062 [Microbacterium phage vB_MoxS-ISF9]
MTTLDGNKIDRYGTHVPHWAPEDADTPETYAADASGELRAIVNPRADGFGYCIETWAEGVGLTTYWSTPEWADAVAFADDFVRPFPESEEDYALACDAMHAANPHRFEGEL